MRIITARPHRLLPAVIAEIGALAQQGRRCMLLVPSQYTLQAEIEVMTQLEIEGSFLIDVLSPGRLQKRVFERAGAPDRIVFDDRGKNMVLAEIIEAEKENLTVYRSTAESGQQGFVSRMAALIADLKRSGKTAQDVMLALEHMDEDMRRLPAARKLADGARIYAAYERRMAGTLSDAEDVSAEMLARLPRSRVMDGVHVFIYGFDMITPTFARQITAMAVCAESMTLAVETDKNAAPDGRLFAPVNMSLQRLRELAGEAGIPCREEHIVAPLDAHPDICMLERGLYALGGRAEENVPQAIELKAVSSARQEAHLCAARIRDMLMNGEDPENIAIVYPRGSGYAPHLAAILPQYGVKAYIAEKRPAGAHPLCRFVVSALAAVSGGFRTADVTECIQSGMMNLTAEETDALCAYMEGTDIRGEAFLKPFAYIKNGDEEALETVNKAREKAASPLIAFKKRIKAADTADDTVTAVLDLLEDVNAFDALTAMRGELTAAGLLPEAEDCAQVWNALMDTLDQLHALLGGRSVPARLAHMLLENGLSALELSALPPADGAIICGEIGNVRPPKLRALFALGMNDRAETGAGGLFTPQEQREAAEATGAYLGMSPQERAALYQLDELKMLSGAGERLIVSYALADETGRALREGTAVQGIMRLFPKLRVGGGLLSRERESQLSAPDAAIEALAVHLSDAADGGLLEETYARAYAALAGSEENREKLLGITRSLGAKPERRLYAAQARALYGRPVMSVSRLETFAQCPYRHFVRYGLSPEEPQEPGVDRAELGTLYHAAAEKFAREAAALPEFPHISEADCERIMDKAITPLIDAWRRSPLGESARGASIARRVRRTAQRASRNIIDQFAGGRFMPVDQEMVFGRQGAAPITLELADGTYVYLQGRIDRIDVLDGTHLRVIDYKSGARQLDPTMIYYGMQLQLLLYLSAALAELPGMRAAGMFYCRIADPTVTTESRMIEEVEKQIAKKLALSGISLSDVEILRAQSAQHAAMIKKDGQPSGTYRAQMATEEELSAMTAFARRKAAQLAGEAYAGRIADEPAVLGAYNACSYCRYSAICGFDPATGRRKHLAKKGIEDIR